ncbi:MAG: hypothetical protein U9R60_08785 [Bacteroidota bacterium]|nr:hypothetical protein [Bacteroidota bacterium]
MKNMIIQEYRFLNSRRTVNFIIDSTVMFFYSDGLGGGGVSMQWGPLCQASETPDKFGVELSMGSALKEQ